MAAPAGEGVHAVPSPRPSPVPPSGDSDGWPFWKRAAGAVGAALAVVAPTIVGIMVWLSGQFADVRRDVADVRVEVGRLGERIDGLGARIGKVEEQVGKLEDRFNAKFGTEVDGGVRLDDRAIWSQAHVDRREKLCRARCDDGRDQPCWIACTKAYNTCGIVCPSTLVSKCFTDCVDEIPAKLP